MVTPIQIPAVQYSLFHNLRSGYAAINNTTLATVKRNAMINDAEKDSVAIFPIANVLPQSIAVTKAASLADVDFFICKSPCIPNKLFIFISFLNKLVNVHSNSPQNSVRLTFESHPFQVDALSFQTLQSD